MERGVNGMFNIGDVIIYSAHGLCKIDNICEKTFSDVTRTYYVLHPLEQLNLTISTPIDTDKVIMLKTLDSEEAEDILQSFKQPGIERIQDIRKRAITYNGIVKTGNRKRIATIANTLMRKNCELSMNKKRLYDQDSRLLNTIQSTLFKELATSLNTSFEEIFEQINSMINE